MTQFGCASITATANENVVPLIFKQITGNIPITNKCFFKFIGFKAPEGTEYFLNKTPNKVPSNGYCITPFDNDNSYMKIIELSFKENIQNLDIWFIY